MAKSFPAKLAILLSLVAAALIAAACTGGEKEAAVSNSGPDVAHGLSVTVYASPT